MQDLLFARAICDEEKVNIYLLGDTSVTSLLFVMNSEENTLQAIRYDKERKKLEILDQLLIPHYTRYIPIKGIEDAFKAIKSMQVRGAPAIAIVGVFSIVVELNNYLEVSRSKPLSVGELIKRIDYLVSSRPTAVNLSNACNAIKKLLRDNFDESGQVQYLILMLICEFSETLYEEDLNNNLKIGDNGVNYIEEELKKQAFEGPFSIITICNTGTLATSGHGTALGIIRSAFKKLSKGNNKDFWLERVYPCETRPYNQGAKLTTYELKYENIPSTLICDNMVTSLISCSKQGKQIKETRAPVKFIIVGADRVAANGDTANKIGTLQLATIADYFNSKYTDPKDKINFIVAAPRTSLDFNTATGDDIVIEERPGNELTSIKGPVLVNGKAGDTVSVGIATPDIDVWNPAFDVTPHDLIDSVVTEDPLVYRKRDGKFHLR